MNLLSIPILIYYKNFAGKSNDLSFGLVKKLQLDSDLIDENWKSFDIKLNALNEGELTMALDGVGTDKKYAPHIEKYIKDHDSEIKNLIAGVYYTKVAWEIRSGTWAKNVSKNQWEGFSEYLEKAHTYLDKPFTTPITQAQAFAKLLTVYRGLSEKESAVLTYQNAIALNNEHVDANMAYFKVLTPKWQGSNEEMIDFVSSKDGNIGTLLKIMYLVEIYSDLFYENQSTAKSRFKIFFAKNYMHTWAKDFNETIEHTHISIYTRNYLACLYMILDMKKERNYLLKTLKGQCTNMPWEYFGMLNERDINLFKIGGLM